MASFKVAIEYAIHHAYNDRVICSVARSDALYKGRTMGIVAWCLDMFTLGVGAEFRYYEKGAYVFGGYAMTI